MALVAQAGTGLPHRPWPFRQRRLTVWLLAFMVTMLWRMLTISHMSLVVGALELLGVVLAGAWLAWRLVKRWLADDWAVNGTDAYVLLLCLLPITSAFGAKSEFGQPLLWGILAFKDYYLLLGLLPIFHWMRKGWIGVAELEKAMVIMAWGCLAYFYFATLFINPAPYQDTPLAGANEVKGGGVYYRFNMAAIYFGAIYYTAKAFKTQQWLNLGYALLFAGYVLVFRMDRTSMAVTAVGMLGVVLFHVPWVRLAKVALASMLPIALAVLAVLLFAPSKVEQYTHMFQDALETVAGQDSGATPVSVRTAEVAIAKRQIEKHPWLGNGRISRTWQDLGYEKWLGFFYPADVGMLGLVFIYGYPGMLVLYAVYLLAALYMFRARGLRNDIFFISCQMLALSLFLDSLTNGQLTQMPAQGLLLMLLMHWYASQRPAEGVLGRVDSPPRTTLAAYRR